MKRLALILGLAFAYACAWAGGIGSAKDLEKFIAAYNDGLDVMEWSQTDSVIVLTADIDLSKVKNLPQIQTFYGILDGQGHCIKGWKAQQGLIREIAQEGIVRNLIIDASCKAKLSSKSEAYQFGFIADTNLGTIQDCENYGSIAHKCGYTSNNLFIGGLAGINRNIILRSANHGKIVSDVIAEQKDEINICVGGLAGGCLGKAINGSTIARCNNDGAVTLITDAKNFFLGGIIGLSSGCTLKYDVNRGEVKADTRAPESGASAAVGHIGGVAGQTKGDVARCDNFAPVTLEGVAGADLGGIIGIPHAGIVVADCINNGTVTAMGELPTHTGGIAGNIGRPVHVRGCINNGKVSFEGVSSRARSTAAGIVGQIYTPKSQTAAASVRNCINHGLINASAGGNKYDSSNKNAIHAAGIVAFADVREGLLCQIRDCSSDGRIVCPSGRKGNICGYVSNNVKTGGRAPADWAVPASVLPDGSTVSGSVKNSAGEPVEGIVVTDGRHCTKTAADGTYKLTSDMSETRFVYLSIPAGAVIPTYCGMPQCFKRVPRYAEAVTADFVLDLGQVSKDYTVLMIADPQVRPFGVDGSMEAWHNTVAPDAEAYRASIGGDVFCINLGDLVYNFMNAWDDYLDGAAIIKCPTFNVIGNHDYDQANLFETEQGNVFFETYVGPEHYSFDLGDIHYVVLNTILYDRPNTNKSYHYGLDDRALEWLRADLSYVPKDKIIMTCSHHNPFKTPNSSPHGSHNVYSLHYADYLPLLSAYKKVYAWNGHNHQNFYYNYEGKDTQHGAPNIQSISVARATGALRLNEYLSPRGEPQGYMVMNVHGNEVSWFYKSVGKDKDYQLRASLQENGSVLCNVWNWSEGWTVPAWYENGEKVADMVLTPGVDPAYQVLFDKCTNMTTRKYCKPDAKTPLWTVTPSEGASIGEVRVTDMFGNTYSETVKLK